MEAEPAPGAISAWLADGGHRAAATCDDCVEGRVRAALAAGSGRHLGRVMALVPVADLLLPVGDDCERTMLCPNCEVVLPLRVTTRPLVCGTCWHRWTPSGQESYRARLRERMFGKAAS